MTKTNFMDFANETHELAKEKGWWGMSEVRLFPEVVALIHSEVSEALEEWRAGRAPSDVYFSKDSAGNEKPEGIGIELADVIIRVLDYCARENIDIDYMLNLKHEYNKTRPFRHGGKKA
jgi:NTP pyrophosphatase (non-canonical NTP hydrolase)